MEDSKARLEIPVEIIEYANTVEVDVDEFLNDIFNNLAQLRKSSIDEISKKKKRFSPALDLVISEVGKFTEMKTKMKSDAESYLQTLYKKWSASFETVMGVIHTKVKDIIEESTLQTSDFEFVNPIQKQESLVWTGLYPNLDGFLDQLEDGKTTKRKRSLAPSTSDSGRKMLRKSTGFQSMKRDKSQDLSEEETVPKSGSSSRPMTRKSLGVMSALLTEDNSEFSDDEPIPISSQKRKTFTLEEKVKLIEAKEVDKIPVNAIQQIFKCSKVQMYNILKNKEEIQREWSRRKGSAKKTRISKNNSILLNRLVWKWFVKERLKKVSVSGHMIQAKAKEIAKDIGYACFKASFDWLDAFKSHYRITWKQADSSGHPTLEAENVAEYLEEEDEDVEEEEEEEEEEEQEPVPPPSPVRRGRKSTGRISMAKPQFEVPAVLSPPSKRTRRSTAKLTNTKAMKKPDVPVIKLKKLSPRTLSSTLKSELVSNKEFFRSFWKPILLIKSGQVLACPAVYQIKVHKAKKPAYIGVCNDLRSQITKYQNGESTKQKQLDKFMERNRADVEVMFDCFNSLVDAERQCKEELNKFCEQFKRNPVFNL